MQPRDELAELPADRRIAGLGALEAQLPAVARSGQIRVALGDRKRDTGRRPPGERPEWCGHAVEPDLREVRDEDRRPRRPRADPAEPLQDGPLADDDRLVGLVDADRPLRGLRHAGDERREPVAGPGASPRTAVLLSGDRHDSERPARLGRQRHAQPVGQADGPDRRRAPRRRSIGSRRPASRRPQPAAMSSRNSSSSPASVPYDWTSIPVTPTRTMMAQPLTVLFMPESAYGPTNNCIGIGDILRKRGHRVVFAAEASWKGRLEPLGFVEDLVDLAPPPAARRARAGRRPVLEGLHPGHVAGVPQADDRAARDVHAADVAGADRRRPLLRAAAPRDHRPPAARRDRRGQRRLVPGADDVRRAVRPDHVVQPARDARPGRPAGLLRPARPTTGPSGRRFARSTTGPTARRGRRSTRSCREQGAPGLPDLEFIHASRGAEPVRLPAGRGLHRPPAARRDVAPPRLERPAAPTPRSSCLRCSRTAPRARRSSTSRWARWAPRTSS